MRNDYFEGILQLRDADGEVVDFVKRQTAKRNDVRISKIAEVRNGMDMYFTSQKYLRALGKKLQEHFKGEMIMSPQLFTVSRTGKELYRVNVLFRPSKLRKGDVITYRGSRIRIIRLENKVFCKYLDTGKSVSLNYGALPRR